MLTVLIFVLIGTVCSTSSQSVQNRLINLESLLKDMRNVSDLPDLLEAKTALSSTWDRTGGNNDGDDFKRIDGQRNVLLDIDGPGVVHRIFTGRLFVRNNKNIDMNRTHLQVFIDHQSEPVIDAPVREFFSNNSFTSYPFVFDHDRTYPGFLLPIPFKEHIKVQLWSEDEIPKFKNWGNFWQVTYTTYDSTVVAVETFDLPLSPQEVQQMKKTGSYWINIEKHGPPELGKWKEEVNINFTNKREGEYLLKGPGVINALRVNVSPNTPEALKNIRFRIYWDGMPFPSVDAPLGYFFGNADYASKQTYHSILLGVDSIGGYSRFPMPFSESARITFSISDSSTVESVHLKLNFTKDEIDEDWGYFHATWTEEWATALGKQEGAFPGELNIPGMPKYGEHNIPVHVAMERKGSKGKYVGMLLHVAWPGKRWWGEGDVLIWSDENGWPPSYHGTGTEEYFNSGWGDFDRKAISGYIKKRPGNVMVYSFHLNDAFNFDHHFKIGLERWNLRPADNQLKCIWGSTSFWYAESPFPAESKQSLLTPRLEISTQSEVEWK